MRRLIVAIHSDIGHPHDYVVRQLRGTLVKSPMSSCHADALAELGQHQVQGDARPLGPANAVLLEAESQLPYLDKPRILLTISRDQQRQRKERCEMPKKVGLCIATDPRLVVALRSADS